MNKNGTNILMVTLDAVRPDHLGCYGYQDIDTPNIDMIAAKGIMFENAVCQCPNTWVSHASIFTGCNPYKHGLRRPYDKLSNHVPYIAELFQQNGYKTAAFPAHNLVGRDRGFDRGFLYFREEHMKYNSVVQGMKFGHDWQMVLRDLYNWVSIHRERFFVWVHYMDVHYMPQKISKRLFGSRVDLVDFSLPKAFRRRYSPKWQFYDGKIAYADKVCVGEIRKMLAALGIEHNTVMVLFADHGEELIDGKIPGHNNNLFDDAMRIPLIIRAPASIFGGTEIKEQVGSIDILPTILDLANIHRKDAFGLDGRSLLDLMNGINTEEKEIYMENLPKNLVGIRTNNRWKLICKVDTSQGKLSLSEPVGLYDIKNDPLEKNDVASKYSQIFSSLKSRLESMISIQGSTTVNETEKVKIEETLRHLGYF